VCDWRHNRSRSRLRSDRLCRSTPSWCNRSRQWTRAALLWLARSHRVHQPLEVCATPRIDEAQLAVENCRVRLQGLAHTGQLVAVLGAALRVEPHIAAVLDGSEIESRPISARRPMRGPGRGDADPAPAASSQEGEGAGLARQALNLGGMCACVGALGDGRCQPPRAIPARSSPG
jgi:hypothetical protein